MGYCHQKRGYWKGKSMNDYVLRTNGISKKYGDVYALKNVNIEIKRGQIYGLIGQNGAGKTTLMRAVMGLIFLSEGEIELFGKTGKTGLQEQRQKIGQSIESPALYPNATAEQSLEIQRIISNNPDKSVIKKTLELIGLADVGRKKTKDFSLGMKQRLALGQALINKPEFIILDEPANGLDPKGIIETRELLRHLAHDEGITLLVSSHLLDELSQVATHYGIIDKGRLIKQLSAEELANEARQYIRIITTQTAEASAMLEKKLSVKDYQIVSPKELRVYEQTDKTGAINTMLVQGGITVEGIGASGQNLEEYFVNLTGGITE
jgi:ABC-2 type transport system ATP-binding protein